MEKFPVTKCAMRPASKKEECFYCKQPLRSLHKDDCVLVRKKVRVRMTVEYEIAVPASWELERVNYQRNESSWCATNALDELQDLSESRENGCLCDNIHFEALEDLPGKFLQEE